MLSAIRQTLFVLIILTLHLPAALAVGVDDASAAPESAFETLSAVEEVDSLDAGPSGSLTPGRMGLYESALMPREGHGAWTSINLGLHRFDYAVSDHVQLGVTTLVPIGVFAALPEIKVGGELMDNLHLAVTARVGGVLGPEGDLVITYGGNALLTYGNEDYHLTAGLHAYGANFPERGTATGWIVHPSLGGVIRMADFALFHVDVGPAILGVSGHEVMDAPSQDDSINLFAVKYGVRFHGDNCFGDVAFLVPGVEEWSEMASILPLGLPSLTFGYAF
jgi:hypothetical protein